MSQAILEKLNTIFRDVLDNDELELTSETTAADVDGWDSLTHIRLMLTVEQRMKVKLTASEIGKLKTVGDLVSLLEKKGVAA